MTPVPGAERLAELHAEAMPQKDSLCGPFWGALVLRAAGVAELAGGPVDEELVALEAGTLLPPGEPRGFRPPGVPPRRDYRLDLPVARERAAAGTSAPALAGALERLSGGELTVVPVAGPWTSSSVTALVAAAAALAPGSTLVANVRTGRLRGSRPTAAALLGHLAGRPADWPPSEWDAGHFATLAGTVVGPSGALVVVRDTYGSLGWGGYHAQPAEAVAAALQRGDRREGGVLCVCPSGEGDGLRERLHDAGYELRHWDNGTPDPEGGDR